MQLLHKQRCFIGNCVGCLLSTRYDRRTKLKSSFRSNEFEVATLAPKRHVIGSSANRTRAAFQFFVPTCCFDTVAVVNRSVNGIGQIN